MREFAAALFPESLFRNRDVVLFEDDATEAEFFPLAVLRPSWEIRYGTGCLREFIMALADGDFDRVILRPRVHLRAMSARLGGIEDSTFEPTRDVLFLNGRLLASQAPMSGTWPETLVDQDGRPLLALRSSAQAKKLLSFTGTEIGKKLVEGAGTDRTQNQVLSAVYSWDYMRHNPGILSRQLAVVADDNVALGGAHALRETPLGIHLIGSHAVQVEPNVNLLPGSVLNTEHGAIWIGSDTVIEPHCYLEGPLYIGAHSKIKAGTKLYQGSSFGPHCRVAGEISQTILQGFVNKQHDGFLGNSHVGCWVNLGADTTVSNLRNDYGNVKMKVGGKLVDSGEQFIGFIAGDHTKTGINAMFNTGTVAGIACNLFGADYPPRYIKSFSWGGASGFRKEPLERALTTAEIVMSRRGQKLSQEERELLSRHYQETVKEEK